MRKVCYIFLFILAACGPSGRPITLKQSGQITSEDGNVNDHFGYAVSLDGDRALVGAPGCSDLGLGSGAGYIFRLQNARWAQEAKLIAADGETGGRFGTAVSIQDSTTAVAARGPIAAGKQSGAVYVFQLAASRWVQTRKLTSVLTNDRFGESIDLDGRHLVVGAPGDARFGLNAGAVHLFRLTDQGWTFVTRIHAIKPAARAKFGAAVAIDGNRLAVGAPGAASGGTGSGEVHLFRITAAGVDPEPVFSSPDPSLHGRFGSSVALTGERLAVGAPGEDGWLRNTGGVYIYLLKGKLWVLEADLDTGALSGGLFFGCSVALTDNLLLGGARGHDVSGWESGSAHLFRRKGKKWMNEAFLSPASGVKNGFFGHAVALEGRKGLIGAYGDRTKGAWAGAAFTF